MRRIVVDAVLVLDGGEPYVGLVVASLGRSGSGHSRARAAARRPGNSSTSTGPRDDAAPLLRLSDAWPRRRGRARSGSGFGRSRPEDVPALEVPQREPTHRDPDVVREDAEQYGDR